MMQARSMHGAVLGARQSDVVFSEQVVLSPSALAPRSAQRFVRRVCAFRPVTARVVNDAAVVAGELVSISVKQVCSSVDLLVEIQDGGVTVRVRDNGALFPFSLHAADTRDCNRHSEIVHRLSRSWGFFPGQIGREVWAVIVRDEAVVSGLTPRATWPPH